MSNPPLLSFALLLLFGASTLPAEAKEPTHQYGRSRDFDAQHLKLDIDIDVEKQKISGVSTLTFKPISQDVTKLTLDSVDLTIRSITVDGKKTDFILQPNEIVVTLNPTFKVGQAFTVAVAYEGEPRTGLHFIRPDRGYPKYPWQVWSQGETEDSRNWFPTYDFPNDKMTTETIVRVDPKFTVISNGALIETKTVGPRKQFHFRQKIPHVSYLVSVVAGEFDVAEDRLGDIPLQYFVPPGSRDRSRKVFRNTATYLKAMEEFTSLPYPYEKYAQVVVMDFMAGAMENTTATTFNEFALYPSAEAEDWERTVDSIIAHEAAHQWFGDLITCESWNHIWLSEGFATYFGTRAYGRVFGADEMMLSFHDQLERIAWSGSPDPTVRFKYIESGDLFGDAVYGRGAWILRMLQLKLGDNLFNKAIQAYVSRFQNQTVETEDFRRIVERETGADLKEFFEQWVYASGLLRLKADWSWNVESSAVDLILQQQPIQGQADRYYRVDIPVEVVTKSGSIQKTFRMDSASLRVSIPLSEKPVTLRVDPEHRWMRAIDFDRSIDELEKEVDSKNPMLVRLDAAQDLGRHRTKKNLEILESVLRSDPFWAVRRNAARALGELALPESWDLLVRGYSNQPSSRVRAEIIKSLSKDSRRETIQWLKESVSRDSSPKVLLEVARLFALQRQADTLPTVEALLKRKSHRDEIQTAFFDGILESGWDRGLSMAKDWAKYGQSKRVRPRAIEALGQIGSYLKDTRDLRDLLMSYAAEKERQPRAAAIRGLGRLGDRSVTGYLANVRERDQEPEVREAARVALGSLDEGRSTVPELKELKKQVEELKRSRDELDRRLKFIEESKKK